MMQGNYQDDVPEDPQNNDVKPMETDLGHHDATYTENDFTGSSAVMREDDVDGDEGYEYSTRRKNSCWHPNAKYIVFLGLFITALAVGTGLTVNNNQEEDEEKEDGPGPAPVIPPLDLGQSPAPVTSPPLPSPVAFMPTLAPVEDVPTAPTDGNGTDTAGEPTEPGSPSFQIMSGVISPPERDDTLPEFINPESSFGHIVAMNSAGDQFVASMAADPSAVSVECM